MSGDARPTLRLRTENFDELAAVLIGGTSPDELARRIGVGTNHLYLIRRHQRTPGAKFIAAVQSAMPHVPFEQLFETVEGDAA
jgi:hypothetical protein